MSGKVKFVVPRRFQNEIQNEVEMRFKKTSKPSLVELFSAWVGSADVLDFLVVPSADATRVMATLHLNDPPPPHTQIHRMTHEALCVFKSTGGQRSEIIPAVKVFACKRCKTQAQRFQVVHT